MQEFLANNWNRPMALAILTTLILVLGVAYALDAMEVVYGYLVVLFVAVAVSKSIRIWKGYG